MISSQSERQFSMDGHNRHRFSGPVAVFRDRALPERGTPVGYAAVISDYDLRVPLPNVLAAIGERHHVRSEAGWRILTPRHAPGAGLGAHLTFALKYEGVDLAVLKRLFSSVKPSEIEAIVRATPTGSYARRIWFLYEWLTGKTLDAPDAEKGTYEPVVDPEQQWEIPGENSARHHVRNNLPGTPQFCPLVFKTPALEAFVSMDLARRARETIAQVPKDLLARAAAFLLLKDSRSSYASEGERPTHNRILRWGQAIKEAGRHAIDVDQLVRLQSLVIGDARFIGSPEEFVGNYCASRQP